MGLTIDDVISGLIDRLWRSGKDTLEIAQIIGRPESDVYNSRARRFHIEKAVA